MNVVSVERMSCLSQPNVVIHCLIRLITCEVALIGDLSGR